MILLRSSKNGTPSQKCAQIRPLQQHIQGKQSTLMFLVITEEILFSLFQKHSQAEATNLSGKEHVIFL
jgi:hypothetical protein